VLGILVLMVLVIAAGLWFEPGYVLVMVAGHALETSLMALAVLLLCLLLIATAAQRLIRWLRNLSRR